MEDRREIFTLEKTTWTHEDFDVMGWHDATIHAFGFDKHENSSTGDFILDIDYIFQWVKNDPPEKAFMFWVAPCTLVFKDAFHLKLNLDTNDSAVEGLEIADLLLNGHTKHENITTFQWTIELQLGQITLDSTGFVQTVRKEPVLQIEQVLSYTQRGGVSLTRVP